MIKNKKQNKNPNKQKKVKKKNSLVQINQATAFKNFSPTGRIVRRRNTLKARKLCI